MIGRVSVDLNLLRTFLAILDAGSVTAAADDLHLTQPTVSHALGRLRAQLGDPLFVRQGSGLVPTDRARELGPILRASVAKIDDALSAHRSFDASTTDRHFRLCLSDLGETAFLPAVLHAMRAEAPRASITAVPTHIEQVTDWLRRGEVDAAVASVPLPVDGVHTIIADERYVALMAPRLAPQKKRLTASDLSELRHAVVDKRVGHEQLDQSLAAIGVKRTTVLRVQHFSVLPPLVTAGDVVTILPAQIAQTVARTWGLEVRELPDGMPRYDVNLYWDPQITGTSGPSAWFISLLQSALTGMTPPPPDEDDQ